jgi:hypothetical protein
MAYNPDIDGERGAAARDLAKLLLGEARRLALQFESVLALDPQAFHDAVDDLAAMVEDLRVRAGAAARADGGESVPRFDGERAERGSDSGNTENFILDIIGVFPEGASVENIFNGVVESGAAMSREALTVRLHRMMRAGKITRPSQGHYALPQAPATPFRRVAS